MRSWYRPLLVTTASILTLAGCAGGAAEVPSATGSPAPPSTASDEPVADAAPNPDPAGDRAATATDAETADAAAAPPTPEEIAAAFAGHGTAHSDHHGDHDAGTPVDFPDGIAEPVRVVIPAIGVDADIVDLDLSGPEPEVPSDFGQTGWYTATREPGEIGPAVIAGHVDSRSGPAVFARLDELAAGDEITVHGTDGATRTFEVTGSEQHPKDQLPPRVFGFGDPVPELRLITCGGDFDRRIGHYRDNVVVFSRLVDA